MIKEIQASTLLSSSRHPDPWFGIKYTMNLYRGCQHQCIYCDSRSACYQIEDFNHDVLVKTNAIDLLEKELPRKRVKGTIGSGSMNDPYMPLEEEYRLTRRALEVIAHLRFPIHIITKSDLVLRDLDLLAEISQVYAAVSLTITTADDALSKKIEPGAPPSSQRWQALQTLSEAGILTGVTLMPVLPFIEDSEENISAIIEEAHRRGAKYILAAMGVTLRDRQREYYFARLEQLFPGLSERYRRLYGDRYHCLVRQHERLESLVNQLCRKYNIATRMPHFSPSPEVQMKLF